MTLEARMVHLDAAVPRRHYVGWDALPRQGSWPVQRVRRFVTARGCGGRWFYRLVPVAPIPALPDPMPDWLNDLIAELDAVESEGGA
jgi:hypothetical protein